MTCFDLSHLSPRVDCPSIPLTCQTQTRHEAVPTRSYLAPWMQWQETKWWHHVTVLLYGVHYILWTRFLNSKLTEHFKKKNLFFKATYVNVVRDWGSNLVNYATTAGAYRKRDAKKDDRVIPHSFTFVRRDCPLTLWCNNRYVKVMTALRTGLQNVFE